MKAPTQNFTRTLAPEGTHIARVIGLIYIGTVKTSWKGEEKEMSKVRITWELPTETFSFKEGELEKPFVVSKEYTFSMGKKSNLRPVVEGILGANLTDDEAYAFDLDEILGKPSLLSLTHIDGENGKFVAINSTAKLVKGMECPPQVNETKVLSYEKWNEEYFNSLPSFIKEKIVSSKEYNAMKGTTPVVAEEDSSLIPF